MVPGRYGSVAAHYQSATEQALVDGDLYDIAMTPAGPRLIIGDVKGKGLEAVDRCAAVLAVFRELAATEPDLVTLATDMDARLSQDLETEDFVTVILAVSLIWATRRSRRRSPGPIWRPPSGRWSACSSSMRAAGSPATCC